MPVCTFDNPATMARECWSDGRMICRYQANLFFIDPFPVTADRFFFGANIGNWKTGQLHGDIEALDCETKTIALSTTQKGD